MTTDTTEVKEINNDLQKQLKGLNKTITFRIEAKDVLSVKFDSFYTDAKDYLVVEVNENALAHFSSSKNAKVGVFDTLKNIVCAIAKADNFLPCLFCD